MRWWLGVLAAGLLPSVLVAQARGAGVVRGVVRDDVGRPLAGVRVGAVAAEASVETDEAGRFRLAGLPSAPTRLAVRRIGFAPETLLVRPGEAAELAVPLRRLAQALDAVVVHGRRDLTGPLAGFYQRAEQGMGRYFTAEDIERRNVARMSDLLRTIPSLQIGKRRSGESTFRLRGAQQAPQVWLDGTPMSAGEVDLDMFDPRFFAGIEIYAGTATVPIEFAAGRGMSGTGGTILLWTRRSDPGPPRRKRGAPTPAAVIAGLLERGEAFVAGDVDTEARPMPDSPLRPLYPDSLYAAGAAGEVEVEFVVLASGRVRGDTFGVITTTHHRLGEAVRRAVVAQQFMPATREGRPVAQLLQLPFSFVPDSGVVARERKD